MNGKEVLERTVVGGLICLVALCLLVGGIAAAYFVIESGLWKVLTAMAVVLLAMMIFYVIGYFATAPKGEPLHSGPTTQRRPK